MRTAILILSILISSACFSQGFYKREKDPQGKFVKYINDSCGSEDTTRFSLLHSSVGVYGGSWKLLATKKDTYTYPDHGWYWADTKKQALILLKLVRISKTDTIE